MSKSAPAPEEVIPELLQRISIALVEGTARSIRHRQQQLNSLYDGLLKTRVELTDALQQELSLTEPEALFEHSLTLQDIRTCYDGISMASENAKFHRLEQGVDNIDHAVPYGIVYIIPLPGIYAGISPLAASIAAGNCVVLELPQTTSRLNAILRNLLTQTLNADTFALTTARPSQTLLERCIIVSQKRDIDLPSGSNVIQSPNNGKCVSFVDREAEIATAAQSIFQSRFAFGGKASYATDIVFVHEAVMDAFKRQLAQLWIEMSFSNRKFDRKQRQQDQYDGFAEIQVGKPGVVAEMETRSQHRQLPDFTSPTLVICSMSSTDDGIDMWAELFGNTSPSAAYIFALPKPANYIAQHVQAHFTTVNQIPLEALIGPQAPIGHSPTVMPRYPPSRFQQKQPQVSHTSKISTRVGGTALDNAKLKTWARSLQTPLPNSGEKEGKRVDFFEQAIMTAAGLTLSVILASGIVGTIWLRRRKS